MMQTMQKKWSKYKRPEQDARGPLRFTDRDAEILELFSPNEFRFLTGEIISCITRRHIKSIRRRLRTLWEHEYLSKYYPPNSYESVNNKEGGSQKAVYYLCERGRTFLSEHLERRIRKVIFDPSAPHPNLPHTIATNRFRGLVMAACDQAGVDMPYSYPDRHFISMSFRLGWSQDALETTLEPDWFFAIKDGGKPIRNFFLELQTAKRRTKTTRQAKERAKTLLTKFRKYYYFWKKKITDKYPNEKYSDIQELRRMRVLVLVTDDMKDQEFENLIALSKQADEQGMGVRLFWFARAADFDLTQPKSAFKPVWRTAVDKERYSLVN